MESKKTSCKSKTCKAETAAAKPTIATRKSCKASGTGLSHYILMDKKGK